MSKLFYLLGYHYPTDSARLLNYKDPGYVMS